MGDGGVEVYERIAPPASADKKSSMRRWQARLLADAVNARARARENHKAIYACRALLCPRELTRQKIFWQRCVNNADTRRETK